MKFTETIKSPAPNRLRSVAIHLSVWFALFMLFYSYGVMMERDFNLLIIIPNMMYIALFYLNYSVLIERLLFKNRVWGYIFANIAIFTALYFFLGFVGEFMEKHVDIPESARNRGDSSLRSIFGHVLFSIMVIAPSLSIKMTAKWLKTQRKIREGENMRVEIELASLKNQLNPHFLFNALNNIYALISFNPSAAQSSLLNVCDLLRYQLYDSDHSKVELDKEVQFLENYCDLMRLRLNDSVRVNVSLPQNTGSIRIAPLLFISLVENAFKHGIDPEKDSYIDITMAIVGSVIHFKCSNSNYPKTAEDRSGSGIGLVNLERRLELIYPHTHTYSVEVAEGDYTATLTINTLEGEKK